MKLNVLVIGCGNIGVQYDLEEPGKVWTHVKAFSLLDEVDLFVMDADPLKAKQAADHFGAQVVDQETELSRFDIISITTPTPTHFHYLERAISNNVPVVICEKPLVSDYSEAERLEEVYKKGRSKVLVNYIRRFQPAFLKLRDQQGSSPFDDFRGTIVKYKRGFLNNASHAIDLLEVLFGESLLLENFKIQATDFDAFDFDPTITANTSYLDQPLSFVGLVGVDYPVFEMELFYKTVKIVICHSGNEIRFYEASKNGLIENAAKRMENILDNYMVPVTKKAIELFHNKSSEDNFYSALEINKRILEVIDKIKI